MLCKLLCLLAFVALASAEISSQFSAEAAVMSSSMDMGGMTMDIVMDGKFYYDYPNQKSRMDFTRVHLSMGGGGGGDDPTPWRENAKNVLQNARRQLAEHDLGAMNGIRDSMMDVDLFGDGTNILRYDQAKNFTWGTNPETNKVECTCEPLAATMDPLFIPRGVADPVEEDVEIRTPGDGKKTIKAMKYSLDLMRGPTDFGRRRGDDGMPALKVNIYVVGSKLISFRVAISMGQMLTMNINMDLDSITIGMPQMEIFEADPEVCMCPEPPVPDVTDSFDACTADLSGCVCAGSDAIKAELEYCTDVNWNIDPTVDIKATDAFVKEVVESTKDLLAVIGSEASDECVLSVKTFMCSFYFSSCLEGGVIKIPKEADFKCGDAMLDIQAGTAGDNRRADSDKSNKAQSPHQSYRTTIGTELKSAGSGGNKAILIGAGVVGAAAIGGGAFMAMKKKSPTAQVDDQYTAIGEEAGKEHTL